MSELQLRTDVFPLALPPAVAVGDEVRVIIQATVRRIEADLVDITPLGSLPQSVLGATTVTMHVNRAEAS
jgi:hypothetical protein